mmetsp:Transcript_8202/g.26968  ORF Transcript_8202/g.26968 Transcript_8202/m.26968 type:complete len:727 (+) Transcript_8202:2711-4891(+)
MHPGHGHVSHQPLGRGHAALGEHWVPHHLHCVELLVPHDRGAVELEADVARHKGSHGAEGEVASYRGLVRGLGRPLPHHQPVCHVAAVLFSRGELDHGARAVALEDVESRYVRWEGELEHRPVAAAALAGQLPAETAALPWRVHVLELLERAAGRPHGLGHVPAVTRAHRPALVEHVGVRLVVLVRIHEAVPAVGPGRAVRRAPSLVEWRKVHRIRHQLGHGILPDSPPVDLEELPEGGPLGHVVEGRVDKGPVHVIASQLDVHGLHAPPRHGLHRDRDGRVVDRADREGCRCYGRVPPLPLPRVLEGVHPVVVEGGDVDEEAHGVVHHIPHPERLGGLHCGGDVEVDVRPAAAEHSVVQPPARRGERAHHCPSRVPVRRHAPQHNQLRGIFVDVHVDARRGDPLNQGDLRGCHSCRAGSLPRPLELEGILPRARGPRGRVVAHFSDHHLRPLDHECRGWDHEIIPQSRGIPRPSGLPHHAPAGGAGHRQVDRPGGHVGRGPKRQPHDHLGSPGDADEGADPGAVDGGGRWHKQGGLGHLGAPPEEGELLHKSRDAAHHPKVAIATCIRHCLRISPKRHSPQTSCGRTHFLHCEPTLVECVSEGELERGGKHRRRVGAPHLLRGPHRIPQPNLVHDKACGCALREAPPELILSLSHHRQSPRLKRRQRVEPYPRHLGPIDVHRHLSRIQVSRHRVMVPTPQAQGLALGQRAVHTGIFYHEPGSKRA